MSAAPEPDVSRRSLEPQPVMWALIAVALLSLLIWLFTKSPPQLMIPIAIVIAGVMDAVSAHLSLADLRLSLQAPNEAIAGQDCTYYVRPSGLRRPVELSRPGNWFVLRTPPVLVDREAPGALTLEAPPRGVIRYLVFDLVGTGPLGLFHCARRLRVWLPQPMHIGPPPVAHVVQWPRQRSIRFGEHEIATVGHDLFRGTRPYVRGDAPRAVHWPATAHHGSLMVKETDGLGIIAFRIVVHLPEPGAASEVTAARAAWLADEAARLGWLVQLVTVEPVAATPLPPPLVAAKGPLPLTPLAPVGVRTVSTRVRSRADVTRQLAAAGFGMPEMDTWQGITRVVSPWGDEWA